VPFTITFIPVDGIGEIVERLQRILTADGIVGRVGEMPCHEADLHRGENQDHQHDQSASAFQHAPILSGIRDARLGIDSKNRLDSEPECFDEVADHARVRRVDLCHRFNLVTNALLKCRLDPGRG
jgi:hypothetical protein